MKPFLPLAQPPQAGGPGCPEPPPQEMAGRARRLDSILFVVESPLVPWFLRVRGSWPPPHPLRGRTSRRQDALLSAGSVEVVDEFVLFQEHARAPGGPIAAGRYRR